jgi:hypothetical protein
MDVFEKEKKKEFELKVMELMVGRNYPMEEVSDLRKKLAIREEAEVFYRDHIQGMTGKDASHHNVEQRFPRLNEKIRMELSSFAEKMHAAGEDITKIEAVIKEFGVSFSISAEKLKSMIKNS